jgi:hypothetical protein
MDEELSFDQPMTDHRQEDLIWQHCRGIDERIRSAQSKDEAQRLVEESCRHFEQSCESKVVSTFLKKYLHDLYEKEWGRRS